jgi:hypothetical protein
VDYAVGAAVRDRADTVPGLTRRAVCGPRGRDRGRGPDRTAAGAGAGASRGTGGAESGADPVQQRHKSGQVFRAEVSGGRLVDPGRQGRQLSPQAPSLGREVDALVTVVGGVPLAAKPPWAVISLSMAVSVGRSPPMRSAITFCASPSYCHSTASTTNCGADCHER